MDDRDPTTERVIRCAIDVHRTLGPGLLESAYEQCMAHELTLQGVDFRLQVPTPVECKGLRLDCAFRADVVVQDTSSTGSRASGAERLRCCRGRLCQRTSGTGH